MSDYERKFIQCDLKMDGDHVFSGIASPYGNVDLGGDIVVKGAFARTLDLMGKERPILWQHQAGAPVGLAHFKDTTEALLVDRGEFEMALPDAAKAHVAIKSRIVKGLSIGYMPVKWEWQKSDDPEGWPVRLLKEVKLYEVSIVTFPMNESALITSVKSGNAATVEFWNAEIKEGRIDRQVIADQLEKLTALLAEKREPAREAGDPVNNHSLLYGLVDQAMEKLSGTTRNQADRA